LSVLVFSGLSIARIEALTEGSAILRLIDVLIAGPYDSMCPTLPGSFNSSKNQIIHFLTDHYNPNDLTGLPEAEVIIGADGESVFSGICPV